MLRLVAQYGATDTDPLPTTAYCWEPIPGRTPYTKGSEMMNASTSCLGRALGFLGMGIGKSIASRNEVQARQPGPLAEVKPIRDDLEQPFGDTTDTKQYATPKQRGMIRARAFDKNLTNTELLLHINKVTDSAFSSIEALSKQQASQVIESLGNMRLYTMVSQIRQIVIARLMKMLLSLLGVR
jgi:hypothetical protein